MGPNSTPENKSEDKAQVEVKTQQLIQKLNQLMDEQIKAIESDTSKTPEQISQERSEYSARLANELRQSFKSQEKIQQDLQQGKDVSADQQEKANQDVHKKMINVVLAADKSLDIVKNNRAKVMLQELAHKNITETQAGTVLKHLGKYILGDQEIVLSQGNEPKSNFENEVALLGAEDKEAYKKIVDSIAERAPNFGTDEAKIREKFKTEEVKNNHEIPPEIKEELRRKGMTEEDFMKSQEDADLGQDWAYHQEYFKPKFSNDQIEFLKVFYTPERFKKYVETQKNLITRNEKEATELKENIKKIYQDINKSAPDETTLNKLMEEQIAQKVSNGISTELTKVLNQLYIRMQLERPQKFFEEVEGEDFMRGIKPTNLAIKSALQKLNTNIAELIKKGDRSFEGLDFAVNREKPYLVQERDKDGKMQPYLRNIPMPYFKKVKVNDFLQNLLQNFDHWIHRESYLHDVRASFNQPPGKEGFYGGLAGYAEKLTGTDIDEMMLLPDGNLVYQAFVLYDKMVEEEFAYQDWKHRPNQFTNKLEYINTQLEQDVVNRLKELYPGKYSESQIINAKNSAVGIARGVFLTEPEKSAYADPTDTEGKGMVASYGTNDAGAINVFNPLQTTLRWQGEHHWNMFYFMPTEGQKGPWDHKQMWKNMEGYMDSFLKGRGKLPEHLFVDDLIDICNVGGPSKRKGWRMQYTLEGHMIYDNIVSKDGKINPEFNPLESFKAMDVIGYEAISDFMNNRLGDDFLKAKDGIAGAQKDKMFRHIFDKYFKEFDKNTSYEDYMKQLSKEGEAETMKNLQGKDATKKDILPAGSFEAQIELETAKLFIERFLVREVAARFPTKFLRMDRDRFRDTGVSSWRLIYERMKANDPGLTRDKFNATMKDLTFAEMLFRTEISKIAKERLNIDNNLTLNQVADINKVLNEAKIREMFGQVKGMSTERIENAINIYRSIRAEFYEKNDRNFLDKEAPELRKKYTYTFGLEDTDFTLMSFRGAGPRTIARAIGDTGLMEREVIPGIIALPRLLNELAINGKHDFSPIIEYLKKARQAFNDVHGTGDKEDLSFTYKIASAVISYFKRDTVAKPLFGLFGMGRRNSMAAEYAGRSSAVWEWDSRDIDRFCVSLESYRLLPKTAFDIHKTRLGNEYESVYWINPITKKPFKTPFTKRKTDFKYSAAKLRKDHGAGFGAISLEFINTILPIIGIFLLYEYIKKALEEVEGKKK